ncbi:MAG: molecular chaperone HtpG [Magnetococcales bacterium]|nr:molecular chaperone HtpG [Magnetococcales bacterium]
MTTAPEKETRQFQTEVRQLLDLMIHSLYSNKEIFLRELISNASDAADKLRFEALSDDKLYEGVSEIDVRITFDKEAGTLTIADSGIGMTRDEVVANIGTIAQSGTKEFLKNLSSDEAENAHLIGQFGVGFYSSFIVADRVALITRRAGTEKDQGVHWESAGDGSYTLETVEKESRGTEVVLYLREDEQEFLDNWRLKNLVQKFSDHISWPILMEKPPEPAAEPEEGEEAKEEEAEVLLEWETVNKASALWTRSKSEIEEEEYTAFYKHISHDFEEPLSHLHVRLEGNYDYTLLLYIPKRPPFDLWDRDRKHGVKLFVKRVFIMEGAEELLPRYLRFMRGVVDSSDLPLNVSREILQQDKAVQAIKKGLVSKSLSMVESLAKAEDGEKYQGFWDTFGLVLKEGVIEDMTNKERLAKLLRFASTQNESGEKPEAQTVSLADYVSRMKEDQDKIYYVFGESHSGAAHSPHLEIFRKKGIEVLLLSDRIDEWLISHLSEFEGKQLQAVSQGDLDLDGDDEKVKEERKKKEDDFEGIVTKVKETLGESVKDVRLTYRLTDSPSCLVGDTNEMSATMERLLREAGQNLPETKRILELNPSHALVVRLQNEKDDGRFGDLSNILLDQAILSEGGSLSDPTAFVKRLNSLLTT